MSREVADELGSTPMGRHARCGSSLAFAPWGSLIGESVEYQLAPRSGRADREVGVARMKPYRGAGRSVTSAVAAISQFGNAYRRRREATQDLLDGV